MSWYLHWSDSIKKRACRYLLQRYLGQFLEEKLTLDQLSVDIYCGTGSVSDVTLDVQALNELGDHKNLPFEFVDGFISDISVSIPWATLFTDSIFVEITGMQITIQPKQRPDSVGSMLESMWSSMASSIQLAAECLKHESPSTEGKEAPEPDSSMEGLEIFASAIESILTRVKIKLVDTSIRLEHLPKEGKNGIALEVKFKNVEYCDETTGDWSNEGGSPDVSQNSFPFSTKKFHCDGISFYTDEFPAECRTFSRSFVSEDGGSGPMSDHKTEQEPILIGKLSGFQDIRVKLKLDPTAHGPKVELEFNLGSFTFFLSPRQLYLLFEIVQGLASPHNQDSSNVPSKKGIGEKLMSSRDFKKVEQDLQETLNFPSFTYPLPTQNRGWSSPNAGEDGEEEFLPMKFNNGMTGSAISDKTTDTSFTSNTSTTYMSSKFDGMNYYDPAIMGNTFKKRSDRSFPLDAMEETSAFHFRLSSLAVVILHEDILTFGIDTCELTPSSVFTMKNLSTEFFSQLGKFVVTGNKDFEASKEAFLRSCKLNHIRLLATTIIIEGNDSRNGLNSLFCTSLSAASLEILECLVENEVSSNKQPQYVELLEFMKNNQTDKKIKPHFPLSNQPDLRMHVQRMKKHHHHSKMSTRLEVVLNLQQCWTEIDLSTFDRIATIINYQSLCHVYSTNKEMNHITSFTEAVENGIVCDKSIYFKVQSPFFVIKFRFPIPDLRPDHEKGRFPWWQRSVRKDILYINLIDVTFFTDVNCEVPVHEYILSCKELSISFQEGNTDVVIPFIKASCLDSSIDLAGNSDHLPRCPVQLVGEVEDYTEKEDNTGLTYSSYMENHNKEPSPFMSKRVVHESDTHHHPASEGEELVIPGCKEDMSQFIKYASEDAEVQVELNLPFLSVEFPSKHLYEVVYNRISTDLALWQSSVPKRGNGKDGSSATQLMHPAFSMCKSGLQFESDESDDDSSDYKINHKMRAFLRPKQSMFSLNIYVNKGIFDVCPNLKDSQNCVLPEKFGEIYFDLNDVNVFFVSNFKGKPQINYVCVQVSSIEVYHKAVVETLCSPNTVRHNKSPPSYLDPILLKSNNEMLVTCMNPEGRNCNMFTAAVSTQVNEKKMKTIRIACSVNGATLRHRVTTSNRSWLTQFMDFFDVVDYPVKGYDSPQVITELHLHLWDSAVDYRPLYFPIKCVLTMGNLSISSNIAARTKTSTLRFIAEEGSFFISDKAVNGYPNLRVDYVPVVQLGLFELSLRLSDHPNHPKIDLKASNNVLHIRTCSDSAAALAQLITYYASDGDLKQNTANNAREPTSEKPAKDVELNLLTESTVERVNDMMEDAMKEISGATYQPVSEESAKDDDDIEIFYFPDEGSNSSPIDWGVCAVDSDHDFCLLENVNNTSLLPESGRPEIRILVDKPVQIIENHFNISVAKSDLLLSPKFYPTPVYRYTLSDMNVVWHMYGGKDFSGKSQNKKNVQFNQKEEETVGSPLKSAEDLRKPDHSYVGRNDSKQYASNKKRKNRYESNSPNWQLKGGPGREHGILMQLQFNKVKYQHEIYPEKAPQASRQVLLIHEFEIRDRLSTSQINKFLYQYSSEMSPRQSHANMMVIKAIHLRPDPRQNIQETCLKVSLLPLRLNIDQDSLQFLVNFFIQLSGLSAKVDDQGTTCPSTHSSPVMGVGDANNEPPVVETKENDSDNPKESNRPRGSSPIFIRNFVFSPDVPIRVDYVGKRVDLTHGPLAGLLMGLGQLSCLQIKLKRLSYKHGLLGFDKLLSYVLSEWVHDIKKTQVPCLIGGVGPMHALVQLFQGIRDLFWLPIEQYQKDGRIVRGLQRGANSFTTSTAIAALELTARIVQAIQSIAEAAFDMVSPGPSVRRLNAGNCKKQHIYSHPADIREGVANAYILVKEGLGETAETLVRVASAEAEQKGAVGAVGGVLRQIPPTVVAPIILASAATSNLLGGVRSQLAPDSRREATYKWKRNVADSKQSQHCKEAI